MDNRAVSPVVGKLLTAALTVLYITSVTGLLIGGVVPDYRAASGGELGERVLATAAGEIERALSTPPGNATVRVTREFPRTIAGERYRFVVRNRTLGLEHPDDDLDRQIHLSVPSSVSVDAATWESGSPLVVSVRDSAANRTLSLLEAPR